MDEEITLRDLYLALRRQAAWIWGLTLGALALAVAVSLLMPPTYESRALVGISLQKSTLGELGLSVDSLASGFADEVKAGSGEVAARFAPEERGGLSARYDAKKKLLTLSAKGRSAEEAKDRAERLLAAFRDYVGGRAYERLDHLLGAQVEAARSSLKTAEARRSILLKALGVVQGPSPLDDSVRALLEQSGVPAAVARSGDIADAYLRLKLAEQDATLAGLQSRLEFLEGLRKDESRLRAMAGESAQVIAFARPGLPRDPVSPRPLLYAALAAVLGLMAGVFVALIREALRDPEREAGARGPLAAKGQSPAS